MYVGEEAFKVTTGERIFLSRLKPHGFIIGSPRIRVLTLFVPGGVEGSFRGMGSPATSGPSRWGAHLFRGRFQADGATIR